MIVNLLNQPDIGATPLEIQHVHLETFLGLIFVWYAKNVSYGFQIWSTQQTKY